MTIRAWAPWTVAVGLLVATVGCGGKADGACGTAEWFERSACDLASLERLERFGVWNTRIVSEGASSEGAFSLVPGSEGINGAALAASDLEGDFYLSATSAATIDGQRRTVVRSYAACRAPEPARFEGEAVSCVEGQPRSTGALEAVRIQRREGEAEASQVALLSETRVSSGVAGDVFVHRPNGPGTTPAYAYVVRLANSGLLTIFDVSNPRAPMTVLELSEPNDFWNAAWTHRNALYIASAAKGVIVFDLAAPAAPVRVASHPSTPVNVHTLFIDEGVAADVTDDLLVANSPGPTGELLFYSIADPLAPVLLSRFVATGTDRREHRNPHDSFLFRATPSEPLRVYANWWASGLVIADLSNPAAPREEGRFVYDAATSHAVAVGRFGDRTIAFEGGEDWGAHLRVVDVTAPTAPKQIGAFKLRDEISIHNFLLVGTRLYIAHYQEGLRILDVSDPASPVQVGYFNTWREEDPGRGDSFFDGAIGIRVPGDGYIYVAETSRGLMIFEEP